MNVTGGQSSRTERPTSPPVHKTCFQTRAGQDPPPDRKVVSEGAAHDLDVSPLAPVTGPVLGGAAALLLVRGLAGLPCRNQRYIIDQQRWGARAVSEEQREGMNA